jgi:dethiobiotin synthetase/adenosylmethionine--8-amino-7-oxononanoate aminotransferase
VFQHHDIIRNLQGNLLAPLRLPALLVGDPALGGISTTLTAYEALLLRGHAVAAVTMMREGRYDNYAAVARHLSGAAAHRLGQGLPVVPLPLCRPPKDGQAAGGLL